MWYKSRYTITAHHNTIRPTQWPVLIWSQNTILGCIIWPGLTTCSPHSHHGDRVPQTSTYTTWYLFSVPLYMATKQDTIAPITWRKANSIAAAAILPRLLLSHVITTSEHPLDQSALVYLVGSMVAFLQAMDPCALQHEVGIVRFWDWTQSA